MNADCRSGEWGVARGEKWLGVSDFGGFGFGVVGGGDDVELPFDVVVNSGSWRKCHMKSIGGDGLVDFERGAVDGDGAVDAGFTYLLEVAVVNGPNRNRDVV